MLFTYLSISLQRCQNQWFELYILKLSWNSVCTIILFMICIYFNYFQKIELIATFNQLYISKSLSITFSIVQLLDYRNLDFNIPASKMEGEINFYYNRVNRWTSKAKYKKHSQHYPGVEKSFKWLKWKNCEYRLKKNFIEAKRIPEDYTCKNLSFSANVFHVTWPHS
jgi:hypothetical protein